jgi:hypothetical protein
MKLQHLNYEKCPYCGAKVKAIEQSSQHSNGSWNEFIKFECHCHIHFSPNFMKEEIYSECQNTKEYKLKKEKREIAVEKLFKYIQKLDVDDEYKEIINRSLNYI